MNLHLVVLIAYSVVLIAGGLWIGRLVRGSADFFVAGRSLGPGLLFATLMAANIGAGSTVGAASLGYLYGLSAWWWVGSAGIGTLLLAFLWAPAYIAWLRSTGSTRLAISSSAGMAPPCAA